jgi:hypothetical protein
MVLMKKVVNANPGDADHVGGNDWDKLSDYFNDTDVSEVPRINNPTEFRSGILKIRDGSNAYNVVMKSATQTANRDFTIPALTTNDSPAMLALQNNYTAINQIQVDADTLLNLYRPVSTTNTFCGLGFFQRNSSNAAVAYAQISNKLITNTSGDEDGKLYFYVRKDGVLTEVMSIDKNGLLTVASVSVAPTGAAQSVITLLNTGAVVTTTTTAAEFDMLNYTVAANQLGLNGALKVRVSGYVIQNGSASGDFTIKVKFGGVIMYQGATTGVSQTATQRPMLIELILGNRMLQTFRDYPVFS